MVERPELIQAIKPNDLRYDTRIVGVADLVNLDTRNMRCVDCEYYIHYVCKLLEIVVHHMWVCDFFKICNKGDDND